MLNPYHITPAVTHYSIEKEKDNPFTTLRSNYIYISHFDKFFFSSSEHHWFSWMLNEMSCRVVTIRMQEDVWVDSFFGGGVESSAATQWVNGEWAMKRRESERARADEEGKSNKMCYNQSLWEEKKNYRNRDENSRTQFLFFFFIRPHWINILHFVFILLDLYFQFHFIQPRRSKSLGWKTSEKISGFTKIPYYSILHTTRKTHLTLISLLCRAPTKTHDEISSYFSEKKKREIVIKIKLLCMSNSSFPSHSLSLPPSIPFLSIFIEVPMHWYHREHKARTSLLLLALDLITIGW